MERFSRRTISICQQQPLDLDSLPAVAEDDSEEDDEETQLVQQQRPSRANDGERDDELSISYAYIPPSSSIFSA